MGHDTIYKEPKLTHLGKKRMAAIGERMNKVMQEHLDPARHDFDKIAGDFRRLVRADEAAEATITLIEHSENNNELEDALETYADLVLPQFDEPDAEFSARLEGSSARSNARDTIRSFRSRGSMAKSPDSPGSMSRGGSPSSSSRIAISSQTAQFARWSASIKARVTKTNGACGLRRARSSPSTTSTYGRAMVRPRSRCSGRAGQA